MKLYFISIKRPFHNPDAFRGYDEETHTRVFGDALSAHNYLIGLREDLNFTHKKGGYWVSGPFIDVDKHLKFITVSYGEHAPKQYVWNYYA